MKALINLISFEKPNNVQSNEKRGRGGKPPAIGLDAGRSLLWALHAPFGAPGGTGKPCVVVR